MMKVCWALFFVSLCGFGFSQNEGMFGPPEVSKYQRLNQLHEIAEVIEQGYRNIFSKGEQYTGQWLKHNRLIAQYLINLRQHLCENYPCKYGGRCRFVLPSEVPAEELADLIVVEADNLAKLLGGETFGNITSDHLDRIMNQVFRRLETLRSERTHCDGVCLANVCLVARCPRHVFSGCVTTCNDCLAKFYNVFSQETECGCPSGVSPVSCPYNTCFGASCPGHPEAECRVSSCSHCRTAFFNSDGPEVPNCESAQPSPGTNILGGSGGSNILGGSGGSNIFGGGGGMFGATPLLPPMSYPHNAMTDKILRIGLAHTYVIFAERLLQNALIDNGIGPDDTTEKLVRCECTEDFEGKHCETCQFPTGSTLIDKLKHHNHNN